MEKIVTLDYDMTGIHLSVDELLQLVVLEKGSDLHCTVGVPPTIRKLGELLRLPHPPLKKEDIIEYAGFLLGGHKGGELEIGRDYDLAYSVPGIGRYRVNIYWQKNNPVIAARFLPEIIPSMEELGLPEILKKFIIAKQGLVLVTGPTGHGKTTSMAAMINYINQQKEKNIITLEDPIEYVHNHIKSNINQREVGTDCESFSQGLRRILRQDPDVVMIGEMRDLESISIAVTAAETGHLVFSTLHTNDAFSSINRIIDAFPAEQQNQIRTQLADSLLMIISQRLLPGSKDYGRVLAYELLINTVPVQNAIREKKAQTVDSIVQTSAEAGMISFEQCVGNLFSEGKITYENALNYVHNQSVFKEIVKVKRKSQAYT